MVSGDWNFLWYFMKFKKTAQGNNSKYVEWMSLKTKKYTKKQSKQSDEDKESDKDGQVRLKTNTIVRSLL